MGSSAARGPCAAAARQYTPHATPTATAVRMDAWLAPNLVASDVGSLGERWRQATGGRERPLRRPNMPGRRGPHKRIRPILTAPCPSRGEELCHLALRDLSHGVA